MKKRGLTKKKVAKILAILASVSFLISIFFTHFYYYKCEDLSCFKSHQANCDKTKFLKDTPEAIWEYKIEEKTGGRCLIGVTMVELKKGGVERLSLKGKSMDCYMLLGDMSSPEDDLSRCTGQLKENLQEIIIQKLHAYVVENLGQISKELQQQI
jgi:hypothetical protein